jgi:type II secretory pathway pseudopilin PulG
MNNKELYKLLKKNKSNSGFTLTELLVGLFMSIFVIGALGFGLMTVLATSQSENSKVKARTENSRALDFVSDEVRRARTIETSVTGSGKTFDLTTETPVLVLNIPEISSTGKIVYYLKSNSGSNWKGPLVLYRWGPPLNSDGSYGTGNISTWDEEALIDGINDTTVTSSCSTGTVTPATPKGFYACITGTNTAQLFLTGQTKTASGRYDDTQTNDSQVVARARTRAANTTNTFASVSWSVKSLGGKYECSRSTSPATLWNMRTDFGNDSTHPDNTTKWIQNGSIGTQPQPIEVDSGKALTITSSAIGPGTGCNSIGNSGKDGSELLSTYPTNLKIFHTVNFGNPTTFNGDRDDATVYNNSLVDSSKPGIRFLKKGDVPLFGGYVANPSSPSSDDQPSLGKFLYEKGMTIISPTNTTIDDPATPVNEILTNPLTQFIIPTPEQLAASSLTETEKSAFTLLGDDQRIIAFEVGQTSPTLTNGNTNPGFDLQDNIFIVTSDVFSKKFPASSFP